MAKGTTVFERWKERRRLANMDTEEKYVNPLDVRLGDIVSLDCLDWRDLDFQVTQFRVVTRKIGRDEFPFTDYYLLHRGTGDDEVRCILRYIPLDEPDPDAGRTHTVLLLHQVDEFEHNQEVLDVLAQNAGYTHFTPAPEGSEEEWVENQFPFRVNDLEIPYDCSVDLVKDENHDGEVEDDEVKSFSLTYWDFWRTVSAEGGGDTTEYLFVEVDQGDGWTELFQGEEIDTAIVTKL